MTGRNLDLEHLKELLCNHSRASIITAIKILLQPEGAHLAQKIFDNLWPPFQKQVTEICNDMLLSHSIRLIF